MCIVGDSPYDAGVVAHLRFEDRNHMAADDTDDIEELDESLEVSDDDDDLDGDSLADDSLEGESLDPLDGSLADDDEADDADGEAPESPKASGDEEDEEDALGPDDVEDDLDTILKGKIASSDDLDDEEDDEDDAPVTPLRQAKPETADGVTAKQEGEFTCPGCFMVVHPRQFGRRAAPRCPFGEEDCPGMQFAFGST